MEEAAESCVYYGGDTSSVFHVMFSFVPTLYNFPASTAQRVYGG